MGIKIPATTAILTLLIANCANAADLPDAKPGDAAVVFDDQPKWFLHLGVGGALFNSSANIYALGQPVPGASLRASDNVTAVFDVGRYLTPNVSATLTAGIPPTSTLTGTGAVATYNKLGTVTYGPAVVAIQYHFPITGPLSVYVGGGVNYTIVFATGDGALTNFKVQGAFAPVLQAGLEYMIDKKWGVYADAKRLFLTAPASGNLGGLVPVTADVRLDPWVVSTGVTYRF